MATNVYWHDLFVVAPRYLSGRADQTSMLTVAGGAAVGGL